MTIDLILFLVLAAIALTTALGMLTSRNTIYAAMHLVTNFITVAIFYLLLDSPFISLAQVTVYAGAIMVLFLFVIMLLGAEQIAPELRLKDLRLQIFLAVVLLAEAVYLVFTRTSQTGLVGVAGTFLSDPVAMSKQLFTNYLLPFEATSILLLVAMVGAIVLTKQEKKGGPGQAKP
jgi:NADH-quinone oxidoreductase subunit J